MSKKPLTPMQQKFVAEYLKDCNGTRAAIAAGYSKNSAKHQAYFLMNKHEGVMAVLSEERKRLQEVTEYNSERAMAEAKEAMEFARETNNANAFVKAAELRAKLNGLLIEKHDHRLMADFQINIVGIDTGRDVNEPEEETD